MSESNKNNKDFFDQSMDEIKLLRYLNAAGNVDEHHILRLYDYFYFKEHLFIVTELLRDNYEVQGIIGNRAIQSILICDAYAWWQSSASKPLTTCIVSV